MNLHSIEPHFLISILTRTYKLPAIRRRMSDHFVFVLFCPTTCGPVGMGITISRLPSSDYRSVGFSVLRGGTGTIVFRMAGFILTGKWNRWLTLTNRDKASCLFASSMQGPQWYFFVCINIFYVTCFYVKDGS